MRSVYALPFLLACASAVPVTSAPVSLPADTPSGLRMVFEAERAIPGDGERVISRLVRRAPDLHVVERSDTRVVVVVSDATAMRGVQDVLVPHSLSVRGVRDLPAPAGLQGEHVLLSRPPRPELHAFDGACGELARWRMLREDSSTCAYRVGQQPYDEGCRLYCLGPAALDQNDVVAAHADIDASTAMPHVLVELSEAGRERFAAVTDAHVGAPIAIAFDGEVMSAPVVMEAIRGGRFQITMGHAEGNPVEAAERLAARLAAGESLGTEWVLVSESAN